MKWRSRLKPLAFLPLPFLMGLGAAAVVWGYDTSGIDLKLYTDPAHQDVTYRLGEEPVPLIVVQRNVAQTNVVTKRGFSERELHQFLIITDPAGRRHYLNPGAPAHRMPMPFFIANRAWSKAESLPEGWERSVLVEDLRNHIAEMNTVAGWYTIQAQQPFVRYASLRKDASLGDLSDINDPDNWKGTLSSNIIQVFVAPAAGAQLKTQVQKVEDDLMSPLPQVTVRVFTQASEPVETDLETLWSGQASTLTGTTNFDGVVVWAATSVCLTRGDYLVVARYGGDFAGEEVKADDEPGWAAECKGSIARTIVFETAPPAVAGDLNGDGIVDLNDVKIVQAYRKQPASVCPPCDIDGDGKITKLDAQKLEMMCTCSGCVRLDPKTGQCVDGDLNGDGIVDLNDVKIVQTYRKQPASVCPPCDIDGDGKITNLDVRILKKMCTCPDCVRLHPKTGQCVKQSKKTGGSQNR